MSIVYGHISPFTTVNIKSMKYLYKYVYKGHDCESFAVQDAEGNGPIKINEIKQYRKARCITAIEAIYRLYRFPMYSMSPPILQMQVTYLACTWSRSMTLITLRM